MLGKFLTSNGNFLNPNTRFSLKSLGNTGESEFYTVKYAKKRKIIKLFEIQIP